MLSRPPRLIRDWPTRTPIHLLEETLSEFLPIDRRANLTSSSKVPLGYHLMYFPYAQSASNLLSDGTENLHSPGQPFTRRVWAGGSLRPGSDMHLNDSQFLCRERIVDVQIKGIAGAERVFVKVSRWIGKEFETREERVQFAAGIHPIQEERTLVFMRDRMANDVNGELSSVKTLRPSDSPDFSHVMTPTAQLLFYFSALTWNAHKIHLDKQYCQEVEGHRNLLVHGPLTLVLMLETLRTYRAKLDKGGAFPGEEAESIENVEYKNLSPLYADEPMKVCVKRKEDSRSYSIWIEGRDGELAVKGNVQMRTVIKKTFSRPRIIRILNDVQSLKPKEERAPRQQGDDMQ